MKGWCGAWRYCTSTSIRSWMNEIETCVTHPHKNYYTGVTIRPSASWILRKSYWLKTSHMGKWHPPIMIKKVMIQSDEAIDNGQEILNLYLDRARGWHCVSVRRRSSRMILATKNGLESILSWRMAEHGAPHWATKHNWVDCFGTSSPDICRKMMKHYFKDENAIFLVFWF